MRDRLHEPYRAPLVPGLTDILANARDHGALGAALSGAGPSVLCFYDRAQADVTDSLESFLRQVLERHGLSGTIRDLAPDDTGVVVRHVSPVDH